MSTNRKPDMFSQERFDELQKTAEGQWEISSAFFVEGNPEAGVLWLQLAAENGFVRAQYAAGNFCEQRGNFEKAIEWYRKAAQQGHESAQDRLDCLPDEFYARACQFADEKQELEIIKWSRRAAELGHAQAQIHLAFLFEQIGCKAEAVKWYTEAAKTGEEQGIIRLINLISPPFLENLEEQMKEWEDEEQERIQNAKNYDDPLRHAAEHGDADAQNELADQLYSDNVQESIQWAIRAGRQGHQGALNNLAFHFGCFEVDEKRAEAVKWCCMAAMYRCVMGMDFLRRVGLKVLAEQESKTEEGIAKKLDEALTFYSTGIHYMNGTGEFEKDLEQSKECLLTAARLYHILAVKGNAEAQFAIGNCFHAGHGVEQDDVEAARWWSLAAASGHKAND